VRLCLDTQATPSSQLPEYLFSLPILSNPYSLFLLNVKIGHRFPRLILMSFFSTFFFLLIDSIEFDALH
jgi:hypothetical protein